MIEMLPVSKQFSGLRSKILIFEKGKPDGRYDKVYLCYIDGNEAARHMYEKLGFKATGEEDEDEIVMVKELI